MLAAVALGFGAMWKTGGAAYDPRRPARASGLRARTSSSASSTSAPRAAGRGAPAAAAPPREWRDLVRVLEEAVR